MRQLGATKVFLSVFLLLLMSVANSASGVNAQEPEPWVFTFDSRDWRRGYQAADSKQSIREYLLKGDTVENWRELVTSIYIGVGLTPNAFLQRFTARAKEGCASLIISVLEATDDSILVEDSHQGCHGFPAQREIMRISRSGSGLATLSYAQRGEGLSAENYANWLAVIKVASPNSSHASRRDERKPMFQSLPIAALGPLPEQASSEYFKTMSTGIEINLEKRVGMYSIMLKAKRFLPTGAYLEVYFEDPANLTTNAPVVVEKQLIAGEQQISLLSPELAGFKCWNYEVVVYLYDGKSKEQLLGTHRQLIQSRVHLDKVKDLENFMEAMKMGGFCP